MGNAPYCTTPKGPNEGHGNSRFRIDTGDSFDDMLDEDDDDVSFAKVDTEDVKTYENPRARTVHDLVAGTECAHIPRSLPSLDDDEADTRTSCLALPVATRVVSLFDSLGGDDLDFLGEDED